MQSRLRRILLLAAALAALFGLALPMDRAARADAVCLAADSLTAAPGELGFLYLEPERQPGVSQGAAVRLRPWRSPQGEWVLFVPAACSGPLTVLVTKEGAKLDGQPLETGLRLELADGEHTVTLPGGRQRGLTVLRGGALGAVFLETEGGSFDLVEKDEAKYTGMPGAVTFLRADGSLEYAGAMEQLRGRGNTTWAEAKKPMQLRLAFPQALYGMARAKSWVLLANALDPSYLRSDTALALADTLGLDGTPQSRFVEVYLNGEYRGCYQLCEKVGIGPGRVEIADLEAQNELLNPTRTLWREAVVQLGRPDEGLSARCTGLANEPEDVTGGYLLELEMDYRYRREDNGFVSDLGQCMLIKSPDPAGRAETRYIAGRYQQLEDALSAPDGVDPESGLSFADLIDLESFAGKYLLEEFCKNVDANGSSQYFYKPAGQSSPFYAGPAWDYDFALGSEYPQLEEFDISSAQGFYANQQRTGASFWPRLYGQQAFRQEAARQLHDRLLPRLEELCGRLRGQAGRLCPSVLMDRRRWAGASSASEEDGEDGGAPPGEPGPDGQSPELLRTPAEEQEAFYKEVERLEEFLRQRAAFLAAEWPEGWDGALAAGA